MTKIDIISGFLGAGKTTFIKKLLQEAVAGEQVVLIENEFGEIGIDGGFLKDSGIEIREMNSGCICCSLVGDFGKSLKEVLDKYRPDRVIIEPSGVGKLSDVIKAVRDVSSDMEVSLGAAVTIVDALKCKMYMKNFGEFFNNQIENAGTVILSRTDMADEDKINKALELIRGRNGCAAIVTTPCEHLTGKQLLEIIEKPDSMEQELMEEVKQRQGSHLHGEECGCGHHHDHGEECGHGHHHDHGEECGCGHGRHHDHGEECGCGHGHHHDHGEKCGCGHGHHHDHGEECGCGHGHHHDHDADEVFTSWGAEAVGSCTAEDLTAVLEELAYGDRFGEVLRAKGMLPDADSEEWHYFDLVPEQYEIRRGKPDYTGKICVIGSGLREDELEKAFKKA